MPVSPALSTAARIVLAWLILLLIALATRPLTPIDETRYLSVAWEMWSRGDFLVPYLNGETYSHKPPLLFWLIDFGWWVFGVQEWVARLIAPLFGLAGLFLSTSLARRVWPDSPQTASVVPWLLLGTSAWALYGTVTMFDMPLAFFAVVGAWGIHLAWRGTSRWGWLLLAIAIGGGILAKGPAILVHVLPLALLAPWWADHPPVRGWRNWYLALGGAILGGAGIALLWAIPAAISGGPDYRDAIFWGQTAGRMVESFAHQRPWWWYLPLLPFLLFPWLFWSKFWRSLFATKLDQGERFCIAWGVPVLVIFSLISGKQPHYLLPAIPAFALFFARRVTRSSSQQAIARLWGPGLVVIATGIFLSSIPFIYSRLHGQVQLADVSPFWGALLVAIGFFLIMRRYSQLSSAVPVLSLASLSLLAVFHLAVASALAPAFDLSGVARQVAAAQAEGKSVAYQGNYQAEFHFLGRLTTPLVSVETNDQLHQWARQHSDGLLVTVYDASPPELVKNHAIYTQAYRSGGLAILPAAAVLTP